MANFHVQRRQEICMVWENIKNLILRFSITKMCTKTVCRPTQLKTDILRLYASHVTQATFTCSQDTWIFILINYKKPVNCNKGLLHGRDSNIKLQTDMVSTDQESVVLNFVLNVAIDTSKIRQCLYSITITDTINLLDVSGISFCSLPVFFIRLWLRQYFTDWNVHNTKWPCKQTSV